MLWAYYHPYTDFKPELKRDWLDTYIFNREIEREPDAESLVIDVAHDPDMLDSEVILGLATRGYFWDSDECILFVPEPFNFEEFLEWLKTAIRVGLGDDSPELSPGSEAEFSGTNYDSRYIIAAKHKAQEIEDCEARGEQHPDLMPLDLDSEQGHD